MLQTGDTTVVVVVAVAVVWVPAAEWLDNTPAVVADHNTPAAGVAPVVADQD